MCENRFQTHLLRWYDSHARDLPWRVPPHEIRSGKRPNPYHVWLSEIMLQQTTVAAVRDYFLKFLSLWPTVRDLADAPDEMVMQNWAGLGYYARARNLLKCARIVSADYDGHFPDEYKELLKLPGIGPYTAAAISAIAFDRPETVVDGNVERVMSRVEAVETPLPDSKPVLVAAAAKRTPRTRPGCYAQAVMDLGATICTPRDPTCGLCPVRPECSANKTGNQADLPRKKPKAAKPVRYGIAYVVRRSDGAWLLEKRPERGLLGGMDGWPGSDWNADPEENPPLKARWQLVKGEVRHVFTHFELRLKVKVANTTDTTPFKTGRFVPADQFDPKHLPTVMRKIFDMARSHSSLN